MEALLILISVLTPIITALTEVLKKVVNIGKFQALVPLVFGIILGPLSFIFAKDLSFVQLIWAGLLSGLTSGGFYSVQNIRNKRS